MLQVTDGAAAVFKQVLQQQGAPEAAIRLAAVPTPEGQTGITVEVVETPGEGDQRTGTEGIDVFVSPELAQPLDEAVLDIADTPQGVELVLRPQPGIG